MKEEPGFRVSGDYLKYWSGFKNSFASDYPHPMFSYRKYINVGRTIHRFENHLFLFSWRTIQFYSLCSLPYLVLSRFFWSSSISITSSLIHMQCPLVWQFCRKMFSKSIFVIFDLLKTQRMQKLNVWRAHVFNNEESFFDMSTCNKFWVYHGNAATDGFRIIH